MSLTVSFNERTDRPSGITGYSPFYLFQPFAGMGMSHPDHETGPGVHHHTYPGVREFHPKISYTRHSMLTPAQDRLYNFDMGADTGLLGLNLIKFLSSYFNGAAHQNVQVQPTDSPEHGGEQRPGGAGPHAAPAGQPQQSPPHERAPDPGGHTRHQYTDPRRHKQHHQSGTHLNGTSQPLSKGAPEGIRWSDSDVGPQLPQRNRSPRTTPGSGSMIA